MSIEKSLAMNQLNNENKFAFEKNFKKRYNMIERGYCMLSNSALNFDQESDCEGEIGNRHAISRRHLKLIANDDVSKNHIIATKEKRTFFEHAQHGDILQRTSINEFSSGRWACQVHDNYFKNLDAELIDLSDSENLFKAVCRVVFRHNLLMHLRWIPIWNYCQTESGWNQLKENIFNQPVSDEHANEVLKEWSNVAAAIHSKAQKVGRKLREKDWNALNIRACMLKSKPTVAGWGLSV